MVEKSEWVWVSSAENVGQKLVSIFINGRLTISKSASNVCDVILKYVRKIAAPFASVLETVLSRRDAFLQLFMRPHSPFALMTWEMHGPSWKEHFLRKRVLLKQPPTCERSLSNFFNHFKYLCDHMKLQMLSYEKTRNHIELWTIVWFHGSVN